MTRSLDFCAVCLSPRGPFTREPLGKDDAPVLACVRCTSETVVPRDAGAARRGWAQRDSEQSTERAVVIKANRDQLYADGLCVNGRAHGPHVPGRRHCSACVARARAYEKTRVRGRRRSMRP